MFLCCRIGFGGNPVHPIITAHVLGQISIEISMWPGVVSTHLVDDLMSKKWRREARRWITRDIIFKSKHLILHSSLDFLTSVFTLRDDIIYAVRNSNTQVQDPFQVELAKQGQRRPRSKGICLKSITLFLNIWIFIKKRKNQRIILADYFYRREAGVNKANISFSLRHVLVSES